MHGNCRLSIAACLLSITFAPQSHGQTAQSAQNRLSALLSLENEIETYVQARNWTDLQRSLEPGKWEQAAETALSLLQSVTPGANQQYEVVQGTIRYKPPEDEADRPVWQDGDTEHLNILLAEIGYDAKRLGVNVTTIGPNAQGTKAILTRLIGRINAERDNATQRARDEATKAANDAKLANVQAQRDSLYAEKQSKWAQYQACTKTPGLACFTPCSSMNFDAAMACNYRCNHLCDSQAAAFQKASDVLGQYDNANYCWSGTCIILPSKQ